MRLEPFLALLVRHLAGQTNKCSSEYLCTKYEAGGYDNSEETACLSFCYGNTDTECTSQFDSGCADPGISDTEICLSKMTCASWDAVAFEYFSATPCWNKCKDTP